MAKIKNFIFLTCRKTILSFKIWPLRSLIWVSGRLFDTCPVCDLVKINTFSTFTVMDLADYNEIVRSFQILERIAHLSCEFTWKAWLQISKLYPITFNFEVFSVLLVICIYLKYKEHMLIRFEMFFNELKILESMVL